MGSTERLFVYGSLMNGMDASELLASRAEYLGRGVIVGQLFDLGEYPAAVKSSSANDLITGEVYELKDNRLLGQLDEYEEYQPGNLTSLFYRERVEVWLQHPEERAVSAWVYYYNPRRRVSKKRRIRSGDYRLAKAG